MVHKNNCFLSKELITVEKTTYSAPHEGYIISPYIPSILFVIFLFSYSISIIPVSTGWTSNSCILSSLYSALTLHTCKIPITFFTATTSTCAPIHNATAQQAMTIILQSFSIFSGLFCSCPFPDNLLLSVSIAKTIINPPEKWQFQPLFWHC